MRISDWSSDVCSSDLCPIAARTLVNDTHPSTFRPSQNLRPEDEAALGTRQRLTGKQFRHSFPLVAVLDLVQAVPGNRKWRHRSSSDWALDNLQDRRSVWKFGLWALTYHASMLDIKGQLAAQAIARRHTAIAKQNR